MASSIKLEPMYITICITMVLYTTYIVALKVYVWCTSYSVVGLWHWIYVYMLHSSGAGISVDSAESAPAMQALWCRMYKIKQSLIYLYNVCWALSMLWWQFHLGLICEKLTGQIVDLQWLYLVVVIIVIIICAPDNLFKSCGLLELKQSIKRSVIVWILGNY